MIFSYLEDLNLLISLSGMHYSSVTLIRNRCFSWNDAGATLKYLIQLGIKGLKINFAALKSDLRDH